MGIKGRKRKLRERELAASPLTGEGDGAAPCRAAERDAVVVMGDGPFQPPVDALGRLKMKKSEVFKMQDQAYLDRVREEHSARKQSHRRQRADGDDEESTRVSLIGRRAALGGGGVVHPADVAANEAMAEAEQVTREYLVHRTEPEHKESEESKEDRSGYPSSPQRKRKRKELRSPRAVTAAAASSSSPSSSSPLLACSRDTVDMREHRRHAGKGARFDHPLIALDAAIVAALHAEGFLRMTKIQERTIPYVMEGYDLLGQARTGSGKTLAFCVPILHACKDTVRRFPRATAALMLAPTKELCVQSHDVLTSICQHIPSTVATFTVQLITGGTRVTEERRKLAEGPSLVLGTPGRIHDHVLHCTEWDLSRLRFLVLDEADRMLADGFQRDLDAILGRLPKSRQSLLFSATNSKSVRDLARLSLAHTPLFVDTVGDAPTPVSLTEVGGGSHHSRPGLDAVDGVGAAPIPYRRFSDPEDDERNGDSEDEKEAEEGRARAKGPSSGRGDGNDDDGGDAIPSTLRQFCHVVPLEDRLRCLYCFVKRVARTSKAMVFCSTVASTTFHFQMIGSIGFHDDIVMLHGHMKHRQRVQTFQFFRQQQTGVLFCTDVAARGLDIPNVEWILQYDPPLDPTEYIHRIGRTARAGNVGNALLFLTPEEVRFIQYLAKFGITLEKYTAMPERLPLIQEKLEHVLQLDEVVAKSAVAAFRAHVGAYQSHVLKETFNVHRLDLDRLAVAFALTATPHVSLPKNTAEEKKKEYVKGKLKSLNRRKMEALKHYERFKVKPQWEDGNFVGVVKPSL